MTMISDKTLYLFWFTMNGIPCCVSIYFGLASEKFFVVKVGAFSTMAAGTQKLYHAFTI